MKKTLLVVCLLNVSMLYTMDSSKVRFEIPYETYYENGQGLDSQQMVTYIKDTYGTELQEHELGVFRILPKKSNQIIYDPATVALYDAELKERYAAWKTAKFGNASTATCAQLKEFIEKLPKVAARQENFPEIFKMPLSKQYAAEAYKKNLLTHVSYAGGTVGGLICFIKSIYPYDNNTISSVLSLIPVSFFGAKYLLRKKEIDNKAQEFAISVDTAVALFKLAARNKIPKAIS